jgi:hypothetical protein
VRFAGEERPLFGVLFISGLDKNRFPELARAWELVDELLAVVDEICDGDTAVAKALSDAVEATAHGHAALLIDGDYGEGSGAVAAAADMAAAATLALIAGRAALSRPQP